MTYKSFQAPLRMPENYQECDVNILEELKMGIHPVYML